MMLNLHIHWKWTSLGALTPSCKLTRCSSVLLLDEFVGLESPA